MNPEYLGKLTSIAINKAVYKPSYAEIKDKYFTRDARLAASQTDIVTPVSSPTKGSGEGCSSDPIGEASECSNLAARA